MRRADGASREARMQWRKWLDSWAAQRGRTHFLAAAAASSASTVPMYSRFFRIMTIRHDGSFAPRQDAEAVVLDLVKPFRPGRQGFSWRRQAGPTARPLRCTMMLS